MQQWSGSWKCNVETMSGSAPVQMYDVFNCVCFQREAMQCSAAMDVLFLLDGSYSVGKGSFERSKHYAIKLCQALDIGPDKVRILLFVSLFSFSRVSVIIDVTLPSIRCGSA